MPQPSQVPTLRPSPLPTSTPAPSLEAYYKAGYYYLESYAATDCSGSVSSTIGYALDACVPVSYTDPKSSIKSDLYLRHTCSNNRALATYYRTSACVMGTELSSLESASKLNKCTTVPGAAGASQIHRCTSDLSTLPLVQQSVLVGEYGTSTCDLEPVAFQAVPVGCSGQGTSWVKQYCAGSSNSKVIREVFAGTGCVVSASTSLVSNFTVGPTCLINNDTSLLPQSLNNTLVAYKKTTCFTPQPAEPAVTSGYFSRNGFADADCSGPPVYQDGFRLGKCLPLYSLDGIQTGSFYASCVPTPGSSSSAAQTLTRLTFPNAHCKGAAQSEQAPVDGSSCLASATTHGITEAMHFVYNCSAGSSPPITLPSAVVVGGSDFYNVSGVSSTACESESSYDVFSAYAADDTHFKWDPNHSFSITCSDQTWYNQSDAVMHTLPIDTNRGCYSYEDNADYIKLQNDLHLVQPFLRLKLASTASARQLQASTPAETSPPRALTDPSETPEGYALRTYFSDSGCDDGSPSWYEGFRLNTCIQRFDPATGDSMGSVKYQCLDYSSVTESKYPDTTDCTSTGGGGFGSGGSFEPMPTQNCTAISPLQQASASGLYATLLARAQSEWWTCSPDNTALPVPTTAVVHSGFATNDESCSGAATAGAASAAGVGSLALPNYFSAFPTQRCIPLNGTALQSLRYTCQLGEAKVSTYEGAFCQTLVDTVSDGTGDCSADNVFIGSDMDGASLQKHEATSCYNPSDFGSTENYYYGPSTTAKFVYVNLGCRVAPSVPAPDPTNEPTPSPSPGTTTKRPTANPTSKFRPSARPTPKAPTPRPTAANLVIFGVSQVQICSPSCISSVYALSSLYLSPFSPSHSLTLSISISPPPRPFPAAHCQS